MSGSTDSCRSGGSSCGGITFNPNGGAALTIPIPPEVAAKLPPSLIERAERLGWKAPDDMSDSPELAQLAEAYAALVEHALDVQTRAER
jgi:hypothetical protein